ncbi:MAG TPA: helix-turn-helix domain-containing protein [Mycobacteriales bacterium]
MAEKRFLQIADVAEILDVSVRQVRALLERQELIGIQIGGRGQWRIEATELEAYIARCYDAARAGRGTGAVPR